MSASLQDVITVREEVPGDVDAVRQVNLAAFGQVLGAGGSQVGAAWCRIAGNSSSRSESLGCGAGSAAEVCRAHAVA